MGFAAARTMPDYMSPATRMRRWIGAVISTFVVFVLGIAMSENPIEMFSQEELLSVYGFDVGDD